MCFDKSVQYPRGGSVCCEQRFNWLNVNTVVAAVWFQAILVLCKRLLKPWFLLFPQLWPHTFRWISNDPSFLTSQRSNCQNLLISFRCKVLEDFWINKSSIPKSRMLLHRITRKHLFTGNKFILIKFRRKNTHHFRSLHLNIGYFLRLRRKSPFALILVSPGNGGGFSITELSLPINVKNCMNEQ